MTNDISRRTLAQGAAWAVPAIAVAGAAPAFASSTCQLSSVTFPTTATTQTSIVSTPTAGVTATATNKITGSVTTGVGYNMTSKALQGTTGVQLAQNPSANSYQELTFEFSQPVYNVSFTVFDIDWNSQNNYTDNVELAKINGTTPGNFTSVPNSYVQGNGTTSNPWQPNKTVNKSGPLDETEPRTTVKVTLAAKTAVTSFTIRFSSPTKPVALQQIWVGGIQFTTTNCTL